MEKHPFCIEIRKNKRIFDGFAEVHLYGLIKFIWFQTLGLGNVGVKEYVAWTLYGGGWYGD